MKKYIVATVFTVCTLSATGAINDYFKEVLQRGYALDGDSVILPDGSKCLIRDFNSGLCGKDFFDLPYCVPEGFYVWDSEKCCEGLVAYLPRGMDGQAICRKKGNVVFSETMRNPLLWLGILGFSALFFSGILLLKKIKLRKK